MEEQEINCNLKDLIAMAMDCPDVSVTIIDPQGTMLYYNRCAAEILDCQPEYLGSNIYLHHKKATTNPKIEAMLREFSQGRTDPFTYESRPYAEVVQVTLTPIRKNGQFIGCVQAVRRKNRNVLHKEKSDLTHLS